MASDGFFNKRSGTWVSPERAHQHVGESFGGFEKTRSAQTGNFYMRPDGKSATGLSSDPLSFGFMSAAEAVALNLILDNHQKWVDREAKEYEKERRNFVRRYGPSNTKQLNFLMRELAEAISLLGRQHDVCPEKDPFDSSRYKKRIKPYLEKEQIDGLLQKERRDALMLEIYDVIRLTSHDIFLDLKKAAGEQSSQPSESLRLVVKSIKEAINDAEWDLQFAAQASDYLTDITGVTQKESMKMSYWKNIRKARSAANDFFLEQAMTKREMGDFDAALEIYDTLAFEVPLGIAEETRAEKKRVELDDQYEKACALQLESDLEQAQEIFRSLGNWRDSFTKAEALARLISIEKSTQQAVHSIKNGDHLSAAQTLSCLESPLPEQVVQLLDTINKIRSAESSITLNQQKLREVARLIKETRTSILQEKKLLNLPTSSEGLKAQTEAELVNLSATLKATSPLHLIHRSSLEKTIEQKKAHLNAITQTVMGEKLQRRKRILDSFLIKRSRFEELRRQQEALRKDIASLHSLIETLKERPFSRTQSLEAHGNVGCIQRFSLSNPE